MSTKSIKELKKDIKDQTVSKPVRNYRSIIFHSYLVVAVLAFLSLSISAYFIDYFPIDLFLTQTIQAYNAYWFANLMLLLTFLGNAIPSIVMSAAIVSLIYILGFKWEAKCLLMSVIGGFLLSGVLKVIIGRPRPNDALVDVLSPLYSASFPSGHVLFYISLFGFLIFLVWILMKRSLLRTLLLCLFSMATILIAPSRMYLGHHWASDTIGSYLIGSVWLTFMVQIYRKGKTSK